LREIQVRVGRTGHRTHELRLWTSLTDAPTAPALELAQLYARRWDDELYFRELKRQVRKTAVLHPDCRSALLLCPNNERTRSCRPGRAGAHRQVAIDDTARDHHSRSHESSGGEILIPPVGLRDSVGVSAHVTNAHHAIGHEEREEIIAAIPPVYVCRR
jgi:hypothetical protein